MVKLKNINIEANDYLTDREKQVFLYRMQSMTFREIGEKIGLKSEAARKIFFSARSKILQYNKLDYDKEMDGKIVEFSLSYREMYIIYYALQEWKKEFLMNTANRVNRECTNRMEYDFATVEGLAERIEKCLKE